MPLRRCKQNLLTLQATCSFVFDYSTRRLLDLLSKGTPAGGIPLGGTVTFQFCTLALGNSQVGTPGSFTDPCLCVCSTSCRGCSSRRSKGAGLPAHKAISD